MTDQYGTDQYGQYPQTPAPYGGQPYPMVPREHPQGTTVLVLGILGFFVAGICAPFAWYIGSKALKEIRASGIRYSNEQNIVVGRILGIIMTVVLLALLVFVVVFVIVVIAAASSQSS
jgi:uncharacterized membrane protein YjgN (DUF898 family)